MIFVVVFSPGARFDAEALVEQLYAAKPRAGDVYHVVEHGARCPAAADVLVNLRAPANAGVPDFQQPGRLLTVTTASAARAFEAVVENVLARSAL